MFELVEDHARFADKARYHVFEKGSRLMEIRHEIVTSTVFLRYQHRQTKRLEWAGTGFFVDVYLEAKSVRQAATYLITARHILDHVETNSTDNALRVRVNLKSGGSNEFKVGINKWKHHLTPGMDVSALAFTNLWLSDMDHDSIQTERFLTEERMERDGVGPGDNVFIAGLFNRHVGKTRNIPIVRVGNIAAMPSEPIAIDFATGRADVSAFLIECRSIGGLSGSPVFLHRQRDWGGYFVSLLGMILGHWDEDNPKIDTTITKHLVNMGIAIVLPARAIRELLDDPSFIKERNEMAMRIDKINSPTLDPADSQPLDLNQLAKRTVDRSIERLERGLQDS